MKNTTTIYYLAQWLPLLAIVWWLHIERTEVWKPVIALLAYPLIYVPSLKGIYLYKKGIITKVKDLLKLFIPFYPNDYD